MSETDIFASSTCNFNITTLLHVKMLVVRNIRHFDNEIVCLVATLVSLAIAARAPLPLASAKKHPRFFAAVLARFATVDAKTSVEESPFPVQKRLRLLSTSRVPIRFVATSVCPGDKSQRSTAAGQWILSCALVGVSFCELF